MPFKVTRKSSTRDRAPKMDARALALRVANGTVTYLGTALRQGFAPADHSPRPRKGDGKPRGLDTGYLSRNIRMRWHARTKQRAAIEIMAPPSRREFVKAQGDVITLDGDVIDVIREQMTAYVIEATTHEQRTRTP